ncbi:MAG: hypothetical protein JSU96_06605 [Acidobacteriota bacterium]|nr:MAG: hypothetical protein JSU96_06605 [Acidobacteriota bacterium]
MMGKRFAGCFIAFILSVCATFGQISDPVRVLVDVYSQGVVGQAGTDTFVQDLIITNGAATTCSGAVLLTDGAGNAPGSSILTNGSNQGHYLPFTIPPGGSHRLTFTDGEPGLETFGTWVEFWDPGCGQQLATETRYRVEGRMNEVFSSPPQPLIPAGSCTQFPVHMTAGTHDTGFAALGLPPWNPLQDGSELCFELLDKEGVRQPGRKCQPYNGGQTAINIGEVFPDSRSDGFEGSVEICYANGAPGTYVAPTAIGVFNNPQGPQFSSSALQTTSPNCESSPNTLCLNDGRFKVEVDWQEEGQSTPQRAGVSHQRDDSGLFHFVDSSNWELLVKVLDGCDLNDRFWVFAAATTNVEFDLTVTDTIAGQSRTFSNPLGTPAGAITDTSAFATCP